MALSDLAIVRRSLEARLFSTATTVLTVGVAVGLILTLLSMRDSGRRAFERGTGNMHLLVSADSSPLSSVLNSIFYANAPQRALPYARAQALADDPRVDFAIPIQQGDSFRGFRTLATVPAFFTRYQPDPQVPFAFADGRAFEQPFEVVLGARVAERTGLRVGDTLFITHGFARDDAHDPVPGDTPQTGGVAGAGHDHDHAHGSEPGAAAAGATGAAAMGAAGGSPAHIHADNPFTVVGVLEPTGSAHDRAVFMTLEASWLIHATEKRAASAPGGPAPRLEDLRDDEKLITGIYVGVRGRPSRDGGPAGWSAAPVNMPVLFSELRRDPTLTVAGPARELQTLFDIVGSVDRILVAIAWVVLASSGVAIGLALANSMGERRRQIAVLRVLGATRARVFGLILTESAVIGLLGAACGIVMAFVGAQVAAGALRARLGLVIDPGLPWTLAVPVAAAAVLLACAAGLAPAVMGYRVSVARSLRPLG